MKGAANTKVTLTILRVNVKIQTLEDRTLKLAACLLMVIAGQQIIAQQSRTYPGQPDWAGETFVSCHDSEIFDLSYCGDSRSWCEGERVSFAPLTSFKVTHVRASASEDGAVSVFLVFEGVLGRKSVSVIAPVGGALFSRDGFRTIVEGRLMGLPAIPGDWTIPQIAAIEAGRVIAGMDRQQVSCSIGDPEQVNDYGDGLTQEIYNEGNLLVYWDHSDRVVSVQTFH